MMTLKCFPPYWLTLCEGDWWVEGEPTVAGGLRHLNVSIVVSLNKLLDKVELPVM